MKIIFAPEKPKDAWVVSFPAKSDTTVCRTEGGMAIEIGVTSEKITRRSFITLSRKMIALAKEHGAKDLAVALNDLSFPECKMRLPEMLRIFSENVEMANLEFLKHKSNPKDKSVRSITLLGTPRCGKPGSRRR
jgi:hypothetical protein